VRLPIYEVMPGENGTNEAGASSKPGDVLLAGGCNGRDTVGTELCMVNAIIRSIRAPGFAVPAKPMAPKASAARLLSPFASRATGIPFSANLNHGETSGQSADAALSLFQSERRVCAH
jgi:hypothetical protein